MYSIYFIVHMDRHLARCRNIFVIYFLPLQMLLVSLMWCLRPRSWLFKQTAQGCWAAAYAELAPLVQHQEQTAHLVLHLFATRLAAGVRPFQMFRAGDYGNMHRWSGWCQTTRWHLPKQTCNMSLYQSRWCGGGASIYSFCPTSLGKRTSKLAIFERFSKSPT